MNAGQNKKAVHRTRSKRPFDDVEKRRAPRERLHNKVKFNVLPGAENRSGITLNLSDSGMCILSFEPVLEGEKILFRGSRRLPSRNATVVWVKSYLVHLCRAGLMFTK